MNDNITILDNYISILDINSSKRKKELSALKKLILKPDLDKDTSFFAIRATLPIIYAHYEGFMKLSITELLKSLQELNLNPDSVHKNLLVFPIILKIDNNIKNQDKKINKLLSLFDDYFTNNNSFLKGLNFNELETIHEDISIILKLFFKNESLSCNVLQEDISKLSDMCKLILDNNNFITSEKEKINAIRNEILADFKLDKTEDYLYIINILSKQLTNLYKERNPVAHGNTEENLDRRNKSKFFINTEDNNPDSLKYIWSYYCDLVVSTINLFKNIFLNFLRDEMYLNT